MRERNEWSVLNALMAGQPLTRAQLAQRTRLSRPTVGNAVTALRERGLVDEHRAATRPRVGAGRPGALVRLVPHAAIAAGVAIDRFTARVLIVDLGARVLAEHAEAIPDQASGQAILRRASRVIRRLTSECGSAIDRLVGVGVGLPGPVNLELGGVDPASTLTRWAGLDVRRELSRLVGGAAVFPDNDANYGALGELHHGAGRGHRHLIYVRVGPGVGGGLVLNGQLYRGEDGYAGQIGHIQAVPDGLPCPCGGRGCLSTVASSWAIARRLHDAHGPGLTSERIIELAGRGDPQAEMALREAGGHIGRVLAALVNALNPGLIVIGGTIGSGAHALADAMRDAIHTRVQVVADEVLRVSHAELDHTSEVLGAATRVLRDEQHVQACIAAL